MFSTANNAMELVKTEPSEELLGFIKSFTEGELKETVSGESYSVIKNKID